MKGELGLALAICWCCVTLLNESSNESNYWYEQLEKRDRCQAKALGAEVSTIDGAIPRRYSRSIGFSARSGGPSTYGFRRRHVLEMVYIGPENVGIAP